LIDGIYLCAECQAARETKRKEASGVDKISMPNLRKTIGDVWTSSCE
jgi:hypothetical protein